MTTSSIPGLPHSIDAEQAVLGAILLENGLFGLVCDAINADDFFRDAHRRIFDKMAKLAARGDAIDLVTLKDELQRSGDIDAVGGPAYIASLVDGMPRSTNVEHYAAIVKDGSRVRRLEAITSSALRALAVDPARLGNGVGSRLLAEIHALVDQARDVASVGTGARERWRLLDDVAVDALPDPKFSIDRVLTERGIGVIYGPSGSCKTTLEASIAVAHATKRNWFGHRVLQTGTQVYVGAEDVPGWKLRLQARKRDAGFPATERIGCLTFPDALDLRDSSEIDRFVRFVRDIPSGLAPVTAVSFDTFAASTPGASENSSEDMTAAMLNAQKVRDALGVSVRIIHHSNASGTRERGHSSMRGAADTMISLTPVDDAIHLECSKQRNGAPFEPILLKLVPVDGGGCVLRAAGDVLPSTSMTPIQEKVFRVLQGFSQDGATKGEWQRACLDVNERSFHRAAGVLEDKLLLVQRVGGKFRAVGEHPHD